MKTRRIRKRRGGNNDLLAVQKDGMALKTVEHKDQHVVMEAVKQNGLALEYVKEQTEEINLEAIKQNWKSIKHVKEPNEEIYLIAMKQNTMAFQFVPKEMRTKEETPGPRLGQKSRPL